MIEKFKPNKEVLSLFQNIELLKNKKLSDRLVKLILFSNENSSVYGFYKDKKIVSAIMLTDVYTRKSILKEILYSFPLIIHLLTTIRLTFLNFEKPRYDNYIEILFLSTSKQFQHKGYAKKLLRYTVNLAEKNNYTNVLTQTNNSIALRLYTSVGFVVDHVYKSRDFDYYFLRYTNDS